jgi:hypothetical protein
MKITTTQLRQIIKEELLKEVGYHDSSFADQEVDDLNAEREEEWEVWLGKDKGNNLIKSMKKLVWARDKDHARLVAKKEYPGYGVMAVAHWESGGLDAND